MRFKLEHVIVKVRQCVIFICDAHSLNCSLSGMSCAALTLFWRTSQSVSSCQTVLDSSAINAATTVAWSAFFKKWWLFKISAIWIIFTLLPLRFKIHSICIRQQVSAPVIYSTSLVECSLILITVHIFYGANETLTGGLTGILSYLYLIDFILLNDDLI
jgi:hypothetical protein